MAAMTSLMVALAVEVYLIARVALESRAFGFAVATTTFAISTAVWFVWPWASRRRRG